MKSLAELHTNTRENGGKVPGLFTWELPMLSETLSAPGTMISVGGDTGSGKSMFGLRLMDSVDVPGLVISLEDPLETLGLRVREMRPERREAVWAVGPRPRLSSVVAAIREAYDALLCPKIVCVDYIQLLRVDRSEYSRTDEIGEIIAELKYLARELGFVLVINSQLTRPRADNRDRRPTRWDFKDSSAIENASETCVMLFPHGKTTVEAWVEKNKAGRFGATAWFERDPRTGYLLPGQAPANDTDEGMPF